MKDILSFFLINICLYGVDVISCQHSYGQQLGACLSDQLEIYYNQASGIIANKIKFILLIRRPRVNYQSIVIFQN